MAPDFQVPCSRISSSESPREAHACAADLRSECKDIAFAKGCLKEVATARNNIFILVAYKGLFDPGSVNAYEFDEPRDSDKASSYALTGQYTLLDLLTGITTPFDDRIVLVDLTWTHI
jgi:hypothetical protein